MLKCWGVSESRLGEMLAPVFDSLEGSGSTTLAFLAGEGVVRVRLTVRAAGEVEAEALLDIEEERCREVLGDVVFGVDDDTLASVCVRLLADDDLTVACAESMTGGQVALWLTEVPGSSDVFKGSAVTYATDSKVGVLGVPADLVAEHGPVSEAVAREMALRVCDLYGSDVGLSVTGSAGPEPQGGSAVGETYLGVAVYDEVDVVHVRFPGDRERVRMFRATTLLDLLRRRLGGTRR